MIWRALQYILASQVHITKSVRERETCPMPVCWKWIYRVLTSPTGLSRLPTSQDLLLQLPGAFLVFSVPSVSQLLDPDQEFIHTVVIIHRNIISSATVIVIEWGSVRLGLATLLSVSV